MKRCSLFLLLVLSACYIGEPEEKFDVIDIVSVEVDAGHLSPYSTTWVIAYAGANPIAMDELQLGETTTLRSDAVPSGASVTISIVGASIGSPRSYGVTTFTDITVGATLHLEEPGPSLQQPERSGVFNGTVTGIPGSADEFIMTDKFGARGYPQNTGAEIEFSGYAAVDGSDYNLVVRATDGTLKHKMIESVKGADVLNIDWSQMEPYEKVATFSFPESNGVGLFVGARGIGEDATYYIFNSHEALDTHSSITAGYPDNTNQYATFVAVNYPTHTLGYEKLGAPATDQTLSNPGTYRVIDASLSTYSASVTGPFSYRVTTNERFNATLMVKWTVLSPGLAFSHPDLPLEIVSAHPELALDKTGPSKTVFVLGPETYEAAVIRQFAPASEHEAFSIVMK
jgi:hypothetical protein